MTELIDERLENIREIYEELSDTKKIDDKTKKLIQEFLEQMDNTDKYIEQSTGVTYKNFRAYKEHKVKILIYNNLDKISKDLVGAKGSTLEAELSEAIVLDNSFFT